MLKKNVLKEFAILATMNDVVFYFVGLQVTNNPLWFMYLLDISTPETRSRLLMSIILKNTVVFIFMLLKAAYSSFDINQTTTTTKKENYEC